MERFHDADGRAQAKRKDFPDTLAKQWNDKPNRYREPKGEEIIGITWKGVVFPTRIHQWTMKGRRDMETFRRPVEQTETASVVAETVPTHRVRL